MAGSWDRTLSPWSTRWYHLAYAYTVFMVLVWKHLIPSITKAFLTKSPRLFTVMGMVQWTYRVPCNVKNGWTCRNRKWWYLSFQETNTFKCYPMILLFHTWKSCFLICDVVDSCFPHLWCLPLSMGECLLICWYLDIWIIYFVFLNYVQGFGWCPKQLFVSDLCSWSFIVFSYSENLVKYAFCCLQCCPVFIQAFIWRLHSPVHILYNFLCDLWRVWSGRVEALQSHSHKTREGY